MKKGVANTPIVSVIMGVYNAGDGRRLEQAVQSILAQTLQDWELIICDDGSTDGTPTRLQALQGRDGRIKVLYSGINRKLALIAQEDDISPAWTMTMFRIPSAWKSNCDLWRRIRKFPSVGRQRSISRMKVCGGGDARLRVRQKPISFFPIPSFIHR